MSHLIGLHQFASIAPKLVLESLGLDCIATLPSPMLATVLNGGHASQLGRGAGDRIELL